jgi:hypothetical protein
MTGEPRDPLRLMADGISLEGAWTELNKPPRDRAAGSTFEALAYALRERGIAALGRDANRHRLAQLSDRQLKDLILRLRREQSRYPAAPITDELLLLLAKLLPGERTP